MTIKSISLAATALVLSTSVNSALVSTGDIVTVNFDISGNPGVVIPPEQMDYQIIFTPFGSSADMAVNPGESFTLDWFENISDSTPLQTDDPSPFSFDVYSFSNGFFGTGLEDVSGKLVMSNIIGDFNIASISMRTLLNDGSFTSYVEQSFVVTPIPIPAAIWLFGSGLIGLIGFAKRKTWC